MLKKHGVINPSCLEEVKQKRKETNLRVWGFENSSQNPEVKAKTLKTMNERFGGNAPACCKEILDKIKNTNTERYGAEWSWMTEDGKEKRREACIEKFGVPYATMLPETIEKRNQTCLKIYGRTNIGQFGTEEHKKAIKDKYGVDYISQSEEIKNKTKKTNLKTHGVENILTLPKNQEKAKQGIINKFGVTSVSLIPEIAKKMEEGRKRWRESAEYPEKRKQMTEHIWQTRKKNNTWNTSSDEKTIYKLLKIKFPLIKKEYKSELYPFSCDYYIPEIDTYIEYQGSWTHGKNGKKILGPYNINNPEHQELLLKWENKAKNSKYYQNAIKVWTIRDPLKRKTAKDNNLNWLEFWTIDEFNNWYNSL